MACRGGAGEGENGERGGQRATFLLPGAGEGTSAVRGDGRRMHNEVPIRSRKEALGGPRSTFTVEVQGRPISVPKGSNPPEEVRVTGKACRHCPGRSGWRLVIHLTSRGGGGRAGGGGGGGGAGVGGGGGGGWGGGVGESRPEESHAGRMELLSELGSWRARTGPARKVLAGAHREFFSLSKSEGEEMTRTIQEIGHRIAPGKPGGGREGARRYLDLAKQGGPSYENDQKRAQGDLALERLYARAPLADRLMQALDNLDRALAPRQQAGDTRPLAQGV